MSSKSNDDVIGLEVTNKKIHYFPQGLEKFFKNLKLIWINGANLKEIHQSDLKPFPNLVFFYLPNNYIEVLEEGLFDYNPNLEALGFDGSKVSHIDSNVFDKLDKLSYFWSGSNACISKYVFGSKQEVKGAITLAKSQCISSEFTSLDEKVKTLENELKTLSSEAFMAKLTIFEETFKSSKFSKFRPLKNKFEDLKALTIINSITTTTQKPQLNPELEKSSNTSNAEASNEEIGTKSCSKCCKIDEVLTSIVNYQSSVTASLANHTMALTNVESSIRTHYEEKITNLDEKLENLDDRFATSNGQNSRKLDAIQKEFDATRYKTLVSIDAKLKSIENRLMEKIEKTLDQKLAKLYKALNVAE